MITKKFDTLEYLAAPEISVPHGFTTRLGGVSTGSQARGPAHPFGKMPMITKKFDTLEYLAAPEISVPHGFTTRLGGVSTGSQASLNLAYGRGDTMENVETNIRRLAQALAFDPAKLVMTHQVHTDVIRPVTAADAQGLCHRVYPDCDGLVTNQPGVALMVFTADCTPILFHDPVTGAVGAVHAGWRGTALDIAGKTVETMVRCYGCRPEDIRAAIGPNIGQCHFETNADVAAARRTSGPPSAPTSASATLKPMPTYPRPWWKPSARMWRRW